MIFDEKILKQYKLRHSSAQDLRIHRRRHGKGFAYYKDGKDLISNANVKAWYEGLAVPPVYKDVVLCVHKTGHLQAQGVDTTGSVQYFYHPQWEALRDFYKFERLKNIAERLPAIRRRVRDDFNAPENDKYFVLAALVKLLDETGLRIGNPVSAKENGTHGLSTLRKKHILQEGEDHLILEFKGKGGVDIEREIESARVRDILEDFYERPGRALFSYNDDRGRRTISPAQINNYINDISKIDMTAKEFRTWRSSALFTDIWMKAGGADKTLGQILDEVGTYTGNTAATLRNSYIHPKLIEAKKDEAFCIDDVKTYEKTGLRKAEQVMMGIIGI